MSADRIDITDHPSACIELWGNSSLGYAAYGPVGFLSQGGRVYLIAERPLLTFSDGERHLWDCLIVLAAGDTLTEADITGCPHLDASNVHALRAAAEMGAAA